MSKKKALTKNQRTYKNRLAQARQMQVHKSKNPLGIHPSISNHQRMLIRNQARTDAAIINNQPEEGI